MNRKENYISPKDSDFEAGAGGLGAAGKMEMADAGIGPSDIEIGAGHLAGGTGSEGLDADVGPGFDWVVPEDVYGAVSRPETADGSVTDAFAQTPPEAAEVFAPIRTEFGQSDKGAPIGTPSATAEIFARMQGREPADVPAGPDAGTAELPPMAGTPVSEEETARRREQAPGQAKASHTHPPESEAAPKFESLFKRVSVPLFWMFFFCFLETVFRVFTFKEFKGMLFPLLFAAFTGLAVSLAVSFFGKKGGFAASAIVAISSFLLYGTQYVYHHIFKTYVTLFSTLNGAGDALSDFLPQTLEAIGQSIVPLLLMTLPMLFLLIFGRRLFDFSRRKRRVGYRVLTAVSAYAVCVLTLVLHGTGLYTPFDYYFNSEDVAMCHYKLGIATGTAIDVKMTLFGPNETDLDINPGDDPLTPGPGDEPDSGDGIDRSPNVEDIDFDALIAQTQNKNILTLHEYFKAQTPSNKNEYTGMFEGYNLIYITAEGFSSWAVDEKYTPTLYKLVNEGFVFNNYYVPLWGVSTLDGEYALCTGLYPKTGVWSFYRSGLNGNDMRYCLGNVMGGLGYSANAYHNHTYSYYNRDISHPNMGYDYKGVGNGLKLPNSVWPNSDLEMMEATVDDYINNDSFHAYYMTVSGHLNYTFTGNSMAAKNRETVADMEMGENARAYMACHVELDRALEYLLARLEAAGKLENTVIVMGADHYPYGLNKESIDELAGHVVEEEFELYKSSLVLWSGSMEEPVAVDKICSSVDVLPTVLNLMGIEYDSRLLSGTDILSDSPAFVLFNNASFITDKCRYNAITGEVVNLTGTPVDAAFIEQCKQLVATRRKVAAAVLDYDYYSYLN